MTAPQFRSVDAHTGEVAAVPASLTTAQVMCEHLAAERDKAVERVEFWRAEADNINGKLVDATAAAHRLAVELKHALDDRNEYMDRVDELEREVDDKERGKTPADVCVCGHTRYNHDPARGCAVDDNYEVPPCDCTWFQDVTEPV